VFQNIETANNYLNNGGDPNVKQSGETALVSCIRAHQPEIAKLLINTKGINVNELSDYHDTCATTRTAIIAAIEYPEIIKLLINEGANSNFQEVVHAETTSAQSKLTALMKAIIYGYHESARILIENGAKLDIQDACGNTALMHAANRLRVNGKEVGENKEDTKLLVENGANLNTQNLDGMTALMITASKGLPETAKILISKKADIELPSAKYGPTALQWAIIHGQTDMAKLLLKSGAKVDGHSKYGETPLMQAAQYTNLEMTQLLIEKGANINSQSSTGQTPLMCDCQL
jgi:FOG: Ankyrin repeat